MEAEKRLTRILDCLGFELNGQGTCRHSLQRGAAAAEHELYLDVIVVGDSSGIGAALCRFCSDPPTSDGRRSTKRRDAGALGCVPKRTEHRGVLNVCWGWNCVLEKHKTQVPLNVEESQAQQ